MEMRLIHIFNTTKQLNYTNRLHPTDPIPKIQQPHLDVQDLDISMIQNIANNRQITSTTVITFFENFSLSLILIIVLLSVNILNNVEHHDPEPELVSEPDHEPNEYLLNTNQRMNNHHQRLDSQNLCIPRTFFLYLALIFQQFSQWL